MFAQTPLNCLYMYAHPFNNLVLLVKRTSHPHSTPPPPPKKKKTNKREEKTPSSRHEFSKHPHIRTYDFEVQADQVLIYRVLSEKSARKCSLNLFQKYYTLYILEV